MAATLSNVPTAWSNANEAVVLVRRYPDLSAAETDRLVEIYPKLPVLQLALMASDEELAPRLDAFRRDHARRLRTPARDLAALLSPVFLLAVVLAWAVLK